MWIFQRGAESERAAIAAQLEKVKESGYAVGRSFFEGGKRKESKLGGGAHARKSGLKICDAREFERVSHELERGSHKTFKENKEYAIEHAKCSTSLESQDARVIQLENELKSERSKRMAFERAHVGSKDEIIARDEMLHWANGEVERYGILFEEVKEEKENHRHRAKLQEQCDDYKRIAERAFGEKENVEEEMRMLLSSQIRREEEFDIEKFLQKVLCFGPGNVIHTWIGS